MENGWIKLHRKILKWEWYQDKNTKSLFIHLLLKANFEDKHWKGIEIKRGQVLIGRKQISQEINISEQSIRTSLMKLKSTNEITIKSTNKHSIITLNNYETYNYINDNINQQNNHQDNQQLTNNQPTTNQQLTTTKNNKNDKNDKNVENIKKIYSPDSAEIKLSELLLNLISKRNPNFKKPNIQKWAHHINLMMRIDNQNASDIKKVIEWCQADSFWQNNILSTEKLRKQFDQLYLKMNGDSNGSRPKLTRTPPTPEEQKEMDRYAALSPKEQQREDDQSLRNYLYERAKTGR